MIKFNSTELNDLKDSVIRCKSYYFNELLETQKLIDNLRDCQDDLDFYQMDALQDSRRNLNYKIQRLDNLLNRLFDYE